MKIYHLYRIDSVDYDEYDAMIIVANSAKDARKEAHIDFWTDPKRVKCVEVSTKIKGIVLSSFVAG